MRRNDTTALAIIWGRRTSDHYAGNDRRRLSRSGTPSGVRHDNALLAHVIATHIGVAQTRDKRREVPQQAAAAYAATARLVIKA